MDERTRLLEGLDAARETMRQVLAGITTDQEIYPGWTIRQVLAHITGWDEAVTASLRAYQQGGEAAIASYRGIDEYNAQSVETRRELSFEQTRREWELARDELKALIRALTPEQLERDLLYPWGQRGPLPPLVNTFIRHERDHAQEIAETKDTGR